MIHSSECVSTGKKLEMSFGIDGALLIALTASAAVWAKRGEVVEDRLFRIVHFVTSNKELAAKIASDIGQRMNTPSLLLKGFDTSKGTTRLPHSTISCGGQPIVLNGDRRGQGLRRVGSPELISILEWLRDTKQWETATLFFCQVSIPEVKGPCDAGWKAALHHKELAKDAESLPDVVCQRHHASHKGHNKELHAAANVLFSMLAESAATQPMLALMMTSGLVPVDMETLLTMLQGLPPGEQQALDVLYRLLSLPRYRHLLEDSNVRSLLLTSACAEKASDGRPTSWRIAWELFQRINDEAPFGQPYPIRNVFHLCFPAACRAVQPDHACEILREANRREPIVVPEILLHCCQFPLGVSIAHRYIGGIHMAASPVGSEHRGHDGLAWCVATALYQRDVTLRNANSLLSLLPFTQSRLANAAQAVVDVLQQTTATIDAEDVTPLMATVARKGCWEAALQLAVAFGAVGRSAQLRAVAPLALPLVQSRRWDAALHVLTAAFRSGRGRAQKYPQPSAHEMAACAYAAFTVGKTAAGSFWLDRACATKGTVMLNHDLRQAALAATARVSWSSALKMICRGGSASSEPATLYALLRSADHDGAVGPVANALWQNGYTRWKP